MESRRNASSFRLTPYIDRCRQLDLQPLDLRRELADAVCAYDIYKCNMMNLLARDLLELTDVKVIAPQEMKDCLANHFIELIICDINLLLV